MKISIEYSQIGLLRENDGDHELVVDGAIGQYQWRIYAIQPSGDWVLVDESGFRYKRWKDAVRIGRWMFRRYRGKMGGKANVYKGGT